MGIILTCSNGNIKALKNVFINQELDEKLLYAFFGPITKHGAINGKTQGKMVKYYNLDTI